MLALAVLLGALVLLLGLGFVQFERQEIETSHLERAEQLARLLEHQTSNDLLSIEATVESIASTLQARFGQATPEQLGELLRDSLRGHAELRSLSVLDPAGRVLISSTQANVGLLIDWVTLGGAPGKGGTPERGRILAGRDLGDLGVTQGLASRMHVVPLLRTLEAGGRALNLVVLINADRFCAQYELILSDPTVRVVLSDFRAQLQLATSNVSLQPGASLLALPAFAEHLPARESGRYLGVGVDASRSVVAFRALRQWPWVLLVEQPYREVSEQINVIVEWTIGVTLCAWLLVAGLARTALHGLSRKDAIAAERARASSAAQASEARHLAVLQASIDAIITIDANGHILAFNPAAERIFGRDSAAVMGQKMDELLVPNSLRQAHHEGMARYLASGDGPALKRLNRRIETMAMRADESFFPVELSIVSVHVGGEVFFTANVRDITEHKEQKQEMTDLVVQYHAIATDLEQQKLALDHHAIVSISDAEETIIYANDKMVQSSGRSRKDLIGRKLYEFRNYLKPEVYEDLRASMAAGKVWHGELVKRHRDGGNYWVSNTSVPVPDIYGGVRQWINIQTDISALRKTEIALQEARARELEIGNRIQQSLLAATPTHHLPGIWLSCFNQASMVIDGDFVDVIQMGEHCIDIIAGDVMGKGVPAALMGAATKLQFSRSIAELLAMSGQRDGPPQPAAIVSLVHSAMGPHLRALDAFVTLAYVRVDTLHQRIIWVGCGHEESLVLRANGQTELLANQHPPLGILEDMVYTQDESAMRCGDALFLCSDGLADAMGADGERLGHDIVNASVARLALQHQGASAPLHRLRRELLHEGTQVTDDVTMVLLKWVADGVNCVRCELPIELAAMRELRQFVQAQTARAALPEQDAAMFEIAAVEVFTNIVRHAQGLLAGAPVEVLSHLSPQALTLECVYLGEAFSPPDQLVEADLATYPEGGFGLTIIRNLSDKVEYLHHEGVNTVRMHRFIAS